MNLRRAIPSDMTASAVAHLSLLALVLLFSEVHPFGSVTAEPIAVEIVTPQEIAEKQALRKPPAEPPAKQPTPEPDFSLLENPLRHAAAAGPRPGRAAAEAGGVGSPRAGAAAAGAAAIATAAPAYNRPSPICRSNIR